MDNTLYYGALPTIELIRRELCAHGMGALVTTSVRQLARAIGRSAGQMSVHLDRLEADGWIRRLTDHAGTVVEILRVDHVDDRFGVDHPHDRSFTASESDHADDRAMSSDHPTPVRNPAPAITNATAATEAESDHADDPPHTPLYGTKHESYQQQQHARMREFREWGEVNGLPTLPIAALEKAGITPERLRAEERKIRTRGEYTESQQSLILIDCLLRGKPVYSAADVAARLEEASHVAPTHPTPARRDGARSGRQSHPYQRGRSAAALPEPNEQRDREFAEQLAEFERRARENPRRRTSDAGGVPAV